MGWYNNPTQYNAAFFECLLSTRNVSWGKRPEDDFAYLYSQCYMDPVCGLSLISEYFRDLISKDLHEKDVGSQNSLEIRSVELSKIIEKIDKFLGLDWVAKSVCAHWDRYQTIVFSNNGTLKDLISRASVFLLFLALDDRESLKIDNQLAEKYIKIVNELGMPYYPRNLLALKMCQGSKKLIGQLCTDRIKLQRLDTHGARIEFVTNQIEEGEIVVDVGCGEGRYIRPVLRKASFYHGIDIDEEVLETAKKKVENNRIKNVELYGNIDELPEGKFNTVILSEVIEHQNSIEEASALVFEAIKKVKPKKIILTTPNKGFNHNYMLKEGEFRHDDHKFELTKDEFQVFLESFKLKYKLYDFGDSVDGEFCSLGAVIKL